MDVLNRSLRERSIQNESSRIIGLQDCMELSIDLGISLKEIEKKALQEHIIPARYERNLGTLGFDGQLKLLGSRVAVIGCGGLGGVVIEVLARSGVGEMVLSDGDVFSDSNLNRQLLSHIGVMGSSKVEVARERIQSINPAVEIRTFDLDLSAETGRNILSGVHVAVDALDNNPSRKILYGLCSDLEIPVVHGAIGGFIGQVGDFLPGKPTHLDFFAEGLTEKGAEAIVGVPSFAPYVIGSMEAAEVIKILTGVGEILEEKLLIMDMSRNITELLPMEE